MATPSEGSMFMRDGAGADAGVVASAGFVHGDYSRAARLGRTGAGSVSGIIEPKYSASQQSKFLNAKPRGAREAYSSETSARRVVTVSRKFRSPKLAPPPSSPAEQAVHCSQRERPMVDYRVLPAGDTAIVVEFGESIDRQVNAIVLA